MVCWRSLKCCDLDWFRACDCVAQVHNQLQLQFSNLSDDFVRVQADLDEQAEANTKLQAQLTKAAADAQQVKIKYEKDITIITEELESTKSVSVVILSKTRGA